MTTIKQFENDIKEMGKTEIIDYLSALRTLEGWYLMQKAYKGQGLDILKTLLKARLDEMLRLEMNGQEVKA